MRTYLLVVLIIVGMLGAYVALVPVGKWSDADTSVSGAGPG
jgi:hypothetical protein